MVNLPFDSDGESFERWLYNLYRFIMSTDVNVINSNDDVADAKPTVRRSLTILVYLIAEEKNECRHIFRTF